MSSPVSPATTAGPAYELADVFRLYGPAYRAMHALPVAHLQVMRAIEQCRTAALLWPH